MISKGISLTDFVDMTQDEKLMVLNCRNNDGIRKWMYSTDIISKENHIKFIENLKNDGGNKYFLVTKEEEFIGVIYFTKINSDRKSSEFGLYANPSQRGVGKYLMDVICNYGFDQLRLKKLIAEVFVTNEKAIHLYKIFKFEKTVGNTNIINMELLNENR